MAATAEYSVVASAIGGGLHTRESPITDAAAKAAAARRGGVAIAVLVLKRVGPGAPQWGELDAHTDEPMDEALDEVWVDGWSLTVAASSGTHSNS